MGLKSIKDLDKFKKNLTQIDTNSLNFILDADNVSEIMLSFVDTSSENARFFYFLMRTYMALDESIEHFEEMQQELDVMLFNAYYKPDKLVQNFPFISFHKKAFNIFNAKFGESLDFEQVRMVRNATRDKALKSTIFNSIQLLPKESHVEFIKKFFTFGSNELFCETSLENTEAVNTITEVALLEVSLTANSPIPTVMRRQTERVKFFQNLAPEDDISGI